MRLGWGQGKNEVERRQREILDLLAGGLTIRQIFLRFHADGFSVPKTTFYRSVKKILARLTPPQLPPVQAVRAVPYTSARALSPAASEAAGRLAVAALQKPSQRGLPQTQVLAPLTTSPPEPSSPSAEEPRGLHAESSLEQAVYVKTSFSDDQLF